MRNKAIFCKRPRLSFMHSIDTDDYKNGYWVLRMVAKPTKIIILDLYAPLSGVPFGVVNV